MMKLLNQNKTECIKCGKPATKKFSPDLDIKGIGMCSEHEEEIIMDVIIAQFHSKGWKNFEKKYEHGKKNK